jgi:hypothetical protein
MTLSHQIAQLLLGTTAIEALCCRYIGRRTDRIVRTVEEADDHFDNGNDEAILQLPDGPQLVVHHRGGALRLKFPADYDINELNQFSYDWFVHTVVLPDGVLPYDPRFAD